MLTDFERRIILEHTKDEAERERLAGLVDSGTPLAYLIGEWYFRRYTFKITPDCLIPRPDTECTVEAALANLPPRAKFADLCTGSGCMGISILGERTDTQGVAVDISKGALAVAAENAERIGVSDRMDFICADLLTEDPLSGEFDLILSNPPYIPSADLAKYPDLAAEPAIALDGGLDGLIFYRRFLDGFLGHLKKEGAFVFEIGYDQGDALRNLAADRRLSCEILRDYGGNDRVAVVRRLSIDESHRA
ncbi:MAG: peptide chain release factor N(5)-glutamine methyltransferase [Eubacteriales bacterium]